MMDRKDHGRSGHTLVELMVVLSIISVIAVAAIPIFDSYSENGRIDELKATLLKAAAAQERYYASTGQYASMPATLAEYGFPTPPSDKMTLYTGLIFQQNVGMTYWVAGNYDVNGSVSGTYNECWIYFGSVLGTNDSNNFIRLYKETAAESANIGAIPHCPTLDEVCK